jgi:hypothetical protein
MQQHKEELSPHGNNKHSFCFTLRATWNSVVSANVACLTFSNLVHLMYKVPVGLTKNSGGSQTFLIHRSVKKSGGFSEVTVATV